MVQGVWSQVPPVESRRDVRYPGDCLHVSCKASRFDFSSYSTDCVHQAPRKELEWVSLTCYSQNILERTIHYPQRHASSLLHLQRSSLGPREMVPNSPKRETMRGISTALTQELLDMLCEDAQQVQHLHPQFCPQKGKCPQSSHWETQLLPAKPRTGSAGTCIHSQLKSDRGLEVTWAKRQKSPLKTHPTGWEDKARDSEPEREGRAKFLPWAQAAPGASLWFLCISHSLTNPLA